VRSAFCVLLALAASQSMVPAAWAAEPVAPARKAYAIPAGALAPALLGFAGQAGVNLSIDPARTRNLATPGLHGEFTVEEGFARLLAASGLRARHLGGGDYTLEPQAPMAAPAAAAPAAAAPAAAAFSPRAFTVSLRS